MIELTEKNLKNVQDLFSNLYGETDTINYAQLKNLLAVLNDLTEREERVVILRYGLSGEKPRSLIETSEYFDVNKEEIIEIESKAFKKLLHPTRRKYIFDIANAPKTNSYSLKSNLEETDLTTRTIKCLKKINVISIKDLMNARLVDLVCIDNIGRKSIQEVVDFVFANKSIE